MRVFSFYNFRFPTFSTILSISFHPDFDYPIYYSVLFSLLTTFLRAQPPVHHSQYSLVLLPLSICIFCLGNRSQTLLTIVQALSRI